MTERRPTRKKRIPALVWQQTSSTPTYAQVEVAEPNDYHRRNGLVIREAQTIEVDADEECSRTKSNEA